MQSESDEQLVQRMAERDESALLKLHSRYAHQLVAFIGRISSDSDEVMQSALDTFAYVWNHAGEFEPEKMSARAWLVTVAQRTALNHRRGSDLEPMPLQSWDVPARHSEPAKNYQEAVADLSREARNYLELAFYRGLSQRQVAEETGKHVDTVQAEMRQALHQLRQRWAGGES